MKNIDIYIEHVTSLELNKIMQIYKYINKLHLLGVEMNDYTGFDFTKNRYILFFKYSNIQHKSKLKITGMMIDLNKIDPDTNYIMFYNTL